MDETSKQNIKRTERLKRRNELKLQMELPTNKKVKIDTPLSQKKRFRHNPGKIDDNPFSMVYNSPTEKDIMRIKAQDIYDTYNICV